MDIIFTAGTPLVLPNLGVCTGRVSFDPGFPGTYWEPPEEGGVECTEIKDAFGVLVPEEYWIDNGEDFAALEAAVDQYLQAMYAADAQAQAQAWEDSADFDEVPF